MTVKEYLHQAYRLDHKINSDIEELQMLCEMSVSLSSAQFGERVQSSPSGEAPFVKSIIKIQELQDKINAEIDFYVELKEEIRDLIANVEDTDKQMVLRYRYIHNMTWEDIGVKLNADRSTIRRWHDSALACMELPKNQKNFLEKDKVEQK